MDTIQFIQDKENITKHEAIKKAENLIGNGKQAVIAQQLGLQELSIR